MVSSAVERYALCDAGEQLVCMLVQAASSILFNTNSNTGSPCGRPDRLRRFVELGSLSVGSSNYDVER